MNFRSSSSVFLALTFVPIVGCSGDNGPQGVPGPTGVTGPQGVSPGAFEPTLRVALPETGILDRTHDVLLVGTGTRFENVQISQISFGDGITVSEAKVASSTSIRATITISPDAAVGPRDVTVGPYVAKSGFVVSPAITVSSTANETAQVPAEQGGVVRLDVTNHDEYAFDTRSAANAFQVAIPGTLAAGGGALTSTFASWYALIAPLATEGLIRARAENYDDEGALTRTFLSRPDAVRITKRDPAVVAFRVLKPAAAFPAKAFATQSYRGDIPANTTCIVDYRVRVTSTGLLPRLYLFGAAGKAEDLRATVERIATPPFDVRVVLPHVLLAESEPTYLVVVDPSTSGGHTLDFAPGRVTATAEIESATPHASMAAAQALGALQDPPTLDSDAIGGRVIPGTLAAGETDVYAFTTTVDDAIVELAIDASADVTVYLTQNPDVLAGPGMRVATEVGASRVGRIETASTGANALGPAGTYYAVVKSRAATAATYTASLRRLSP